MIPFDLTTLNKVKECCLKKPKEESCGFIYKNNNKIKVHPCKNFSSSPNKTFVIDPYDYELCCNQGEILGCYHSHINERGFSHEDIHYSLETEIPYLLYTIKNDKFHFFDALKYFYYKKYINLPYIAGLNDCWSTIQNFLNNETSIKATEPDPSRLKQADRILSWAWQDRKEWIESMNAFKVEPTPKNINKFKIYDVLILKSKHEKLPTFGALLLEDNLILHQNDHQISKIESLRKGHINLINYVGRFRQ